MFALAEFGGKGDRYVKVRSNEFGVRRVPACPVPCKVQGLPVGRECGILEDG
jgi:hypothetical protein